MDEDPKEQTVVEESASEENSESSDGDSRTWYPYIAKAQFEKFLARMQSKMPEEINRDYIRAIIRTPSMIYRFLRGIEAMKLIDPDQKPTERMVNLVNADSRKQTIAEIMRDLYPDLTQSQENGNGDMTDKDIVAFFRKETGMGNDSANKMKMFYKYLLSEAGGADQSAAKESDDGPTPATPAPESTPSSATSAPTEAPSRDESKAATPAEAPTRDERNATTQAEAPAQNERPATQTRTEAPARNERSAGPSRRGQQRSSSSQSDGGEAPPDRGSSGGSRPISETQQAYLDTLKAVLTVNIDGDWDDDMIRLAFDRLERLFDRVKRG